MASDHSAAALTRGACLAQASVSRALPALASTPECDAPLHRHAGSFGRRRRLAPLCEQARAHLANANLAALDRTTRVAHRTTAARSTRMPRGERRSRRSRHRRSHRSHRHTARHPGRRAALLNPRSRRAATAAAAAT